ncbi:TetR/AcrR family transcriptional regulator [Frateuria defendens]|uniref:TetR/AcrR family transcriptional regulator n=1 Tax=Frateuria defendens TaxID=2219559 RepID=UPI00066FC70E|nr:TetR/AcrR family transcriptional regulator [Frateuria defendens]
MSTRTYRSAARAEAAGQTRARILAAATELLREAGVAGFSLESVGKAAGVTRLTVYNQFGSRRALLEAVFDELAARGGLHRIRDAMADDDPHAGLRRLVGIFCDFWGADLDSLAGLHGAASGDAEFAESLGARNERRRGTFAALVERLVERGEVRARDARDLVDLLFVLTSLQVFTQLKVGKRSKVSVRRLIEAAAVDAVRRAGPAGVP